MTGTGGAKRQISLLPLENAEPGPLRRWLEREAWRTDPVVWLRYEPDADRIVFRLIETPSTAMGQLDSGHPTGSDDEIFLGFDGTTGAPWPTTIALLNFVRHCDEDTSELRVLRELVGGTAYGAALALRQMAGGEDTVRVPPDEAARMTRRWGDLVAGIDQALDDALAALSGGTAPMTRGRHATVTGTPPAHGAPRAVLVLDADAAANTDTDAWTAGDVSRATALSRNSIEGGRNAGRRSWAPGTPDGVGAIMARRSRTAADSEPMGAIPYGSWARLSDIVAAWRDGRANMPAVPADGTVESADKRHGITPYLEIRNRHFLDGAERERQQMLADLAETKRQRAAISKNIVSAQESADAIGRHRGRMPDAPAEPDRRNLLEIQLNVSDALVRARRHREHQAELRRVETLELQARQEVRRLREQHEQLTETIAVREDLLASRVRQLLQHSLRRCATYMRHIVHHHPDGSAVIKYLEIGLPSAPKWLEEMEAARLGSDGPQGPQIPRIGAG